MVRFEIELTDTELETLKRRALHYKPGTDEYKSCDWDRMCVLNAMLATWLEMAAIDAGVISE